MGERQTLSDKGRYIYLRSLHTCVVSFESAVGSRGQEEFISGENGVGNRTGIVTARLRQPGGSLSACHRLDCQRDSCWDNGIDIYQEAKDYWNLDKNCHSERSEESRLSAQGGLHKESHF